MGVAPETKTDRNKKIVEMKKDHSFVALAGIFHLSEKRVKELYYREIAKLELTPAKKKVKKLSTGKYLQEEKKGVKVSV